MNKNYVFAGIGVVGIVAVIIVLVMMNTHPSLAEIVENKDCQELGKYDQRMDEIYGLDVKKAKAEENISNELWSDATSLYWDCSFDAVKSMYGNDSSDEDNTKSTSDVRRDVLREAGIIIHKRDCKEFVEWYDDNIDRVRQIRDYDTYFKTGINWVTEPQSELDSYHKYCKDPNTVLSENGIDVEEKWIFNHSRTSDLNYDIWDSYYTDLYLSDIEETLKNTKSDSEVISEAAEIIQKRDCKQFVEWYDDNIDHVGVLDNGSSRFYDDSADLDFYRMYCEHPDTVLEFLDDNGIDIDDDEWWFYDKWDKK